MVLLGFLIENDFDLLNECRYSKKDIDRFCLDFNSFYWSKMKYT